METMLARWSRWPGWRRHGPVVASAVAHVPVALLIVMMMGASARPAPASPPGEDVLAVELLLEQPPEPDPEPQRLRASVTPPPRLPPPPKSDEDDGAPAAPVIPDPKKKAPATGPVVVAPSASADADGVYLPPSIMIGPGPKGLQGLAGDPCATTRLGLRPKECGTDWATRVGTMDTAMPRDRQQIAQQFGEFITPCPWKVGCEDRPIKSNNGTFPTPARSPASMGPAGLGGINDVVGRLPQNPDFTDPGFGD
jgi:hypothetical protein